MTKRRLVWIFVAIFAIASIVGIIIAANAVHDITLTQTEVQKKIDDKLPATKDGITVKRVQVEFKENLLLLIIDGEGEKLGQKFSISVNARGTPYYDSSEGAFYFRPDDLQIMNLKLNGEDVSNKVEKFIDKYVDSEKINQNKNEISGTIEKWVRGVMGNIVTWTLMRIPIYTLPDTIKGNTVQMMLKSVEIHDGSVTLRLSFWQFTKMVAIYCFVLLLVITITICLAMYPEWGLAFVFFKRVLNMILKLCRQAYARRFLFARGNIGFGRRGYF